MRTSLSIKEKILYNLNVSDLKGIEIGPLVSPLVTKDMGRVEYVDRATTDEIRAWYSKNKTINIDDIVSIDHVWGKNTLAEAIGVKSTYNYCIAAHVIEHVPDLIGWLKEISEILIDGGVAAFSVPDRRYTFDYLRSETVTSELIEAYLNKSKKPTIKQIYDHFSLFTEIDITKAWKDDFDGTRLQPAKSANAVIRTCEKARDEDTYIDTHCWVFTAKSFVNILNKLSEIGLLDFKIKSFFDVEDGNFEFVIQLEKLPSSLSKSEKRMLFLESLEKTKNHIVTVEFRALPVGEAQIYYDLGNGFNEIDSVTKSFSSYTSRSKLEFHIPPVFINKIRFDPVKSSALFTIYSINMLLFSMHSCPLSLREIIAGDHLRIAKQINDTFWGVTYRKANDPHIVINLTSDVQTIPYK